MTNRTGAPFGVIFIGPPGFFAVWTTTPDGRLMDRDSAERLGLYAVHVGAADYRTFPLDDEQMDAIRARSPHQLTPLSFMIEADLPRLQDLLAACGGLPFASHHSLAGNPELH